MPKTYFPLRLNSFSKIIHSICLKTCERCSTCKSFQSRYSHRSQFFSVTLPVWTLILIILDIIFPRLYYIFDPEHAVVLSNINPKYLILKLIMFLAPAITIARYFVLSVLRVRTDSLYSCSIFLT